MYNPKPIIIGITGHRQLRNQDLPLLKEAVRQQLEAVVLKCPNSEVKLLTSLAEGADQLCAEVALELNIGLIAALPMEISEYKLDFHSGALFAFEKFISKAEDVFVVPVVEERDQSFSRDYYYRQADIYIATHSLCLIALWDGSEPKVKGCGTAETVDMALNHTYQSDRCIHYQDAFVIHIMTPRSLEADNAGAVSYLGSEELFNESIQKLDEINKEGEEPDLLSIKYGKKYHNALIFLAVLGTMLALAFLLYDEAMINWMLLVLGAVLIIMNLVFGIANKTKSHQKYIEYRAYAECLRIQNHLTCAGIELNVAESLGWTRLFDTPWIHKAMQTANVLQRANATENIENDWILEQQLYHEQAIEKTKKQIKHNNSIVKSALIFTIAIYIIALLFEYVFCGQFGANEETIRMLIKIAVGTASAASFFAANYYGKLSLKRVYEDHVRMAEFFKAAGDYLKTHKANRQFLYELINEELSENNNWFSYEKDNEIDFSI